MAAEPVLKAVVHLRHVAFRDGRPRFSPGPELRALGFKGEDLRHPDGRWYTISEAEIWLAGKLEDIARARTHAAGSGKRPRGRAKLPQAAKSGALAQYTVEKMCTDMFAHPKFTKPRSDGGVSPKTAADYRRKLKRLAELAPEVWAAHPAALNRSIVTGLYNAIWAATSRNNARAIIAVLGAAYAVAPASRVPTNPCNGLRLKGGAGRVRYGSPAEVAALVAAADALGMHAIGDAIVIALHTFQRQGDVLALVEDQITGNGGRLRFVQSKTGKIVEPRASAQLLERLAAIRERKRAAGLATPFLVVAPHSRTAYDEHWFRKEFRVVRAQAQKTAPSVADFRFQDLRDTAITRAALAGMTLIEICAHSGHSASSVEMIMKSYVHMMHGIADAGADRLEAWMQQQRIGV